MHRFFALLPRSALTSAFASAIPKDSRPGVWVAADNREFAVRLARYCSDLLN